MIKILIISLGDAVIHNGKRCLEYQGERCKNNSLEMRGTFWPKDYYDCGIFQFLGFKQRFSERLFFLWLLYPRWNFIKSGEESLRDLRVHAL